MNVAWGSLRQTIVGTSGLSQSLLQAFSDAALVARAESVEPGFVGALIYQDASLRELIESAIPVEDFPSWRADAPFFRATPIANDAWLAMPDTESATPEIWMFEVVDGPNEPLLAYKGGEAESETGVAAMLDKLLARPELVLSWRRRNRCMRPVQEADCKPDTCTGRCRSYSILDGADLLHLCACTRS